MPRRAAVSRSMVMAASRPPVCWSLATSVSSVTLRSFSTSLGAKEFSSFTSASSSVYWYCAAYAVFDGEVLRRLHIERDALYLCELGLQAADDVRSGVAAL